MAEQSAIEWCDSTFNPWIGCTRVSQGCDDCYAARSTPARTLGIEWGPHAERHRTAPATWKQPEAWERQHAAFFARHGRRRRVFCASLADVFDNAVSQVWRDDLWALIAATPHLDWLLVTKRIGNVGNMLPVPFGFDRQYPHVWLGITVVDQAEADRDIPKLLATPAAVRFVSIEPMLGPIDLTSLPSASGFGRHLDALSNAGVDRCALVPGKLDWVICGGESGPHARPMRGAWAQALRDQCAAADVPFLFKQWGEWLGEHQDGAHDHDPLELNATDDPVRVGKKAAGRLLDGRSHDDFPEVRHARA